MEEFALIKSRVNLNRVNLALALLSDIKVYRGELFDPTWSYSGMVSEHPIPAGWCNFASPCISR